MSRRPRDPIASVASAAAPPRASLRVRARPLRRRLAFPDRVDDVGRVDLPHAHRGGQRDDEEGRRRGLRSEPLELGVRRVGPPHPRDGLEAWLQPVRTGTGSAAMLEAEVRHPRGVARQREHAPRVGGRRPQARLGSPKPPRSCDPPKLTPSRSHAETVIPKPARSRSSSRIHVVTPQTSKSPEATTPKLHQEGRKGIMWCFFNPEANTEHRIP
eukprot:gene5761-biopygen4522